MEKIKKIVTTVSEKQLAQKEIWIKDKVQLEEFLKTAVSNGYNQIRVPAGTSLHGDYSAQVAVIKKNGDTYYIALLPYNSRASRNNLFPKKVKPQNETQQATAVREVWEEMKLSISKEALVPVFRKQDNGNPESREIDESKKPMFKEHLVHRFCAFECEGSIAYFPDFRNPNDPETGQGVWVSLKLLDTLYPMDLNKGPVPFIFWRHIDTVLASMDRIMHDDKFAAMEIYDTYNRLQKFLS